MGKGKLVLIPSALGLENISSHLPSYNTPIVEAIREFIVEDVRTARRFLRKLGYTRSFEETTFHVLDQHTSLEEIPTYMANLHQGHDIGLLSEAGCPCVADPGAEVVAQAHEHNIRVLPLTGPSSVMLALMASGFNGQQFVFHGYLPVERAERVSRIRQIEEDIYRKSQTQIFIETPYRNNDLIKDLIATCQKHTRLCIAAQLTQPGEYIRTLPIKNWNGQPPNLHKKPAIFLLYR